MKLAIGIGATIGGLLGGWLGSFLDKGSTFGIWSILLSTFGGLAGIYLGYRIGRDYME